MSTHIQETYSERLEKYKRREQLTIWIGAGFGAVLVILGIDTVKEAATVLVKTILTLSIIGAACLAYARVGFEWAATLIERAAKISPTHLASECSDPWPSCEKFWTVALWAIFLCGLLLLAAIWVPTCML